MDQLKELFEKQNRLLEAQNRILKEGFEALIFGLAETAPRQSFPTLWIDSKSSGKLPKSNRKHNYPTIPACSIPATSSFR